MSGNYSSIPVGVSPMTAQDGGSFQSSVNIYHVGRWRVEHASRSMTDGSVERRLSPRAARLLKVLADAEGEVVHRQILLDTIWPDVTVTDESLTQAVSELRRAFGERDMIETIAKTGYRLTVPVLREVEETDAFFSPGNGADAFDFESYRLCLEARSLVARGDMTAMELSEALTREAAMRAPRFAMVQSEYAIMAVQRHLYRGDGTDRVAVALHHAEAAVKLRPDLAGGYTALGYALGALERWDEARAAFGRAISLDPSDADAHYWAGRTMYAAGAFRVAAALGERSAVLNRDCVRAPYLATRSSGVFDPQRCRRNAAVALRRIEDRLRIDPREDRSRMARGPLLAVLGRDEAAANALEADPADGSPLEFYAAVAWAMVGETDRALVSLERVTDGGWRHPAWLRSEPALARVSGSRRFTRIARQLGTM